MMIEVVEGLLTEETAEGVMRPVQSDFSPVSASSRDLGVAAGPKIDEKLMRLGNLPLGGAVITPAGALPCDFLIHVVVSSAEESMTAASVQKAVQNGLRRAADMGVESLALPPLGIGVGMTEPEDAARALCEILVNHLNEGLPPTRLRIVVNSAYEASMFKGIVSEFESGFGSDFDD